MNSTRRLFISSMLIVTAGSQINSGFAAESLLKKGIGLLRKNETPQAGTTLGTDEISAGIKEALTVGATKVVAQLGKPDGFNADPAIHIPLPAQMERVKTALARVGMAGTLEDLELRLNRAAEAATPTAKSLFVDSISKMTLTDVNSIYRGDKDAATQYFQRTMTPELTTSMQPIVQKSLADVGAVQVYDQVMNRYNALPLVPKQDLNLNGYVVQLAMNGIFHYMAQEEAAIRENPVARTTDLLKKVFGSVL
jgi:hypothetical protein